MKMIKVMDNGVTAEYLKVTNRQKFVVNNNNQDALMVEDQDNQIKLKKILQ